RLAGVGFVLSTAAGIAVLDLNGVRDPGTGEIDPPAAAVVRDLDTFTEVSQSGAGVHAFAFGRLDPGGRKRSSNIELYSDSRFIAVTGWRVPGTPPTVEHREGVLRRLQAAIGP